MRSLIFLLITFCFIQHQFVYAQVVFLKDGNIILAAKVEIIDSMDAVKVELNDGSILAIPNKQIRKIALNKNTSIPGKDLVQFQFLTGIGFPPLGTKSGDLLPFYWQGLVYIDFNTLFKINEKINLGVGITSSGTYMPSFFFSANAEYLLIKKDFSTFKAGLDLGYYRRKDFQRDRFLEYTVPNKAIAQYPWLDYIVLTKKVDATLGDFFFRPSISYEFKSKSMFNFYMKFQLAFQHLTYTSEYSSLANNYFMAYSIPPYGDDVLLANDVPLGAFKESELLITPIFSIGCIFKLRQKNKSNTDKDNIK
jgi:hypothetical protein